MTKDTKRVITKFSMFDCDPVHLDFFKRTPNLESLILNQDIIFVGGGNTKSMLAVWKDWKLDKLLKIGHHYVWCECRSYLLV